MTPLFSTQAPLHLTSVTGVAGQAVKLTTSGGSGTGKLMFSVQSGPGEDCVVTGDVLKATNRGVCVVVATKSGDGTDLPTVVIMSVLMSLPPKPGPSDVVVQRVEQCTLRRHEERVGELIEKTDCKCVSRCHGVRPGQLETREVSCRSRSGVSLEESQTTCRH